MFIAVAVTGSGNRVMTSGNILGLSTYEHAFSSKLSVYPNPSQNIFTVTTDKGLTIKVYDMSGKIVVSKNLVSGNNKLDMSTSVDGVYLMNVTNENNQSKIIRILKHK